MFAIYAFCRAVDDIADDGRARERRAIRELERWRDDIDALYARRAAGARRVPRAVRCAHYGLRRRISSPSSTAWRWMSAGTCARPTWRRWTSIATGSRARSGGCRSVFGMDEGAGLALAHHLGRALQLTNILRDLDEDAAHRPALSAARSACRGGNRDRRSAGGARRPAHRRGLPRGRRRAHRAFSRGAARSWRRARAASCARRG